MMNWFQTLACPSHGFGFHVPSKNCITFSKFNSKDVFHTFIPFLLDDLKGQLEHWNPRDIVWVFIPPLFELSKNILIKWTKEIGN